MMQLGCFEEVILVCLYKTKIYTRLRIKNNSIFGNWQQLFFFGKLDGNRNREIANFREVKDNFFGKDQGLIVFFSRKLKVKTQWRVLSM